MFHSYMNTYEIMIKVCPHHHGVHAPFLDGTHAIKTIYVSIIMRYIPHSYMKHMKHKELHGDG